jgi:hypothetical protein
MFIAHTQKAGYWLSFSFGVKWLGVEALRNCSKKASSF